MYEFDRLLSETDYNHTWIKQILRECKEEIDSGKATVIGTGRFLDRAFGLGLYENGWDCLGKFVKRGKFERGKWV